MESQLQTIGIPTPDHWNPNSRPLESQLQTHNTILWFKRPFLFKNTEVARISQKINACLFNCWREKLINVYWVKCINILYRLIIPQFFISVHLHVSSVSVHNGFKREGWGKYLLLYMNLVWLVKRNDKSWARALNSKLLLLLFLYIFIHYSYFFQNFCKEHD